MSWIDKFKNVLSKTRQKISDSLFPFLLSQTFPETFWEGLEDALLSSDVGGPLTETLLTEVKKELAQRKVQTAQEAVDILKEVLKKLFPLPLKLQNKIPQVILVVGVNGSGKTTTIAKLGHFYQKNGKKVLLVAADTFRAAAQAQLKIWGDRLGVHVFSLDGNAGASSVIFEALKKCYNEKVDVVLIDTAGRLHTKLPLIEEMKKIKKVIQKFDPDGPHQILLVIDASTGQNGLTQAKVFYDSLGITGLILTKLDGSAKGGMVFSVVSELKVPIIKVGIGEGVEDLDDFSADDFIEAIFSFQI